MQRVGSAGVPARNNVSCAFWFYPQIYTDFADFLFCPQDGRDERLLVRAAFHAAAFERRTPNAELRTSK